MAALALSSRSPIRIYRSARWNRLSCTHSRTTAVSMLRPAAIDDMSRRVWVT